MAKAKVKFGELLEQLREKAGLSQSDIAKAIGVSQPTYSRYEQGTSVPGADTLFALCTVLKVPCDTFASCRF